MDTTHCKHLRIRPKNDYVTDLEKFIKTLERQYKFDFRSLPEWKKAIEIMFVTQYKYKHKLKDAAKRKHEIIENLNKEYSRLSPFQLTDRLARTAKHWELMKSNLRKRKVIVKEDITLFDQELLENQECSVEESEIKSTVHPNTEVMLSKEVLVPKPDESELKSISTPHLPNSIVTNQHRHISPVDSKNSNLLYLGSNQLENTIKSETAEDEDDIDYIYLRKAIHFSPNILHINGNTYKEQSVKLTITNCSMEYIYVRFKGILDTFYFKTFRIVPATPMKLYPGLSFTFKLIFKLKNPIDATLLKTVAKFKVGRNVYSESKDDILCVPIISIVTERVNVKVTETIYIHPVYKWHVTPNDGYPKGLGQVYVDGDRTYHLHIRKKYIDFVSPDYSIVSNEATSPETFSLSLKKEDILEVHHEVLNTNRKNTNVIATIDNVERLIKYDDIMILLDDLLNLAFEPFVFKQTYLRLLPNCKKILQVYFTKPDHIGFHHSYYDLEFRNFHTDEMIMTKTIKVFAEVLPHPITINPQILDMTNSSITLGYCNNYFTITNTHKIYPVTVKIKTTTKMQKIFKITPMETLVPTTSSVNFEVSMCIKENNAENDLDELSYFTIKIIICGHQSIYRNSTPLFYEIIAPCAKEFKQIYGKKYFHEVDDKDYLLTNFHVWVSEYIISSSDCQTGLTIDYKSAEMRLL